MSTTLLVNEIFNSVQGEGVWTGFPATFVRLQGCNLACPFCDTPNAISRGGPGVSARYTVSDLADKIAAECYSRNVVITGGEPMEQWDGLAALMGILTNDFEPKVCVHLETNGTHHIPIWAGFNWITVSPKPPAWHSFVLPELTSEIKLVVGPYRYDTRNLYPPPNVIEAIVMESLPSVPILLQPDNNTPEAIASAMALIESLFNNRDLELPPHKVGLSIQVHKLIGVK